MIRLREIALDAAFPGLLCLPVPAAAQTPAASELERFDFNAGFWMDARTLTYSDHENGVDTLSLGRAHVGASGDFTRSIDWGVSAELTSRSFLRNACVGVCFTVPKS